MWACVCVCVCVCLGSHLGFLVGNFLLFEQPDLHIPHFFFANWDSTPWSKKQGQTEVKINSLGSFNEMQKEASLSVRWEFEGKHNNFLHSVPPQMTPPCPPPPNLCHHEREGHQSSGTMRMTLRMLLLHPHIYGGVNIFLHEETEHFHNFSYRKTVNKIHSH